MLQKQVFILKRVICSKYLFYLLILLLVFALVSLGREVNRRLFLKKQLSKTAIQVESIEAENQELLQEIEKMQTDYFKEKAARLKLGLQKPGEQVIVVVQEDDNLRESESGIKYFSKKISNFKIWWNHFFK